MTFLTRIVSDVLVWLGWMDATSPQAEEGLTPRFGWLLPAPAVLAAQRRPAAAPSLAADRPTKTRA